MNDLIVRKLQDTSAAITNSRTFEVSVVTETVREAIEQVDALVQAARAIIIESNEEYEFANAIKTDLVTLCKKIEKSIEPWKGAFNKAHKMTTELEGLLTKDLVSENKALGKRMIDWEKHREIVRRQAEVAAQAAAAKQVEEQKQIEAKRLIAAGKEEDAQRVLERPAEVPEVLLSSHVPETPGSHNRKDWFFEIEDEDLVPREFCCPDEKKIRAHVKVHEGKTKIPGVRVYSDEQKVTRAQI